MGYAGRWTSARVEVDERVAWVELNRPEKRNASVPPAELRGAVESLARELLEKNPIALRAAKLGFKHCRDTSWDDAEDYLYAKHEQSQFLDDEQGREDGLAQFLDEKRIKPGLEPYERPGPS